MSTLREKLEAQLQRFDDDAFAALGNRGLLRRARKDLEKGAAEIVEETPALLVLKVGEHRIRFDARGAAHAECSCPASGVCQHILAAAITLQAASPKGGITAATDVPAAATPADAPAAPALDQLRAALLAMTPRELAKHAGKAGYRWAWQFVQDLNVETDLTLSGERNVVIAFRHPRLVFRYMGGPLDGMLADTDIKQLEKYRAAAVMAYQRANGVPLTAPEGPAPQDGKLDLGKDHAGAETASASLQESRTRLCAAVRQLACECVTLGLSHFSPGIQERFSTLAVWAQGAQCYRLALLLRRLADHVEMLLERAGGADEHRLFDELTIAYALVAAIESAAARGSAPAPLIGRARNEYEDAGQIELSGLGSLAWRSASGYIGLTMLFWSPKDKTFLTCGDARPEVQRGFDPVARYKASGPWSGLGAPALTTGRRVMLTGALLSAAGRISGSEKTTATIMPRDAAQFIASLDTQSRWSELARIRAAARRSLLAEAQPMKDWVVLRPSKFQRAEFDGTRQTLTWNLVDDEGDVLRAEVAYHPYSAPAIERLEQMDMNSLAPGTLVVAKLRGGSNNFIAEPLSLVRPVTGDEVVVDSLYFDAAPKSGFASRILSKLLRRTDTTTGVLPVMPSATPPVLTDLRHWLCSQAERGVAWDAAAQARSELAARAARLSGAGFTAFRGVGSSADAAADLLRAQYLCLQYEHLLDDGESEAA
ncbi:MAG TPA: hypothetical protein VIV63_16060 [Steroidobacteraceae bacterium]